jgi:hypothetical protein
VSEQTRAWNLKHENDTIALANGAHVGSQSTLICQQRQLRFRVDECQGDSAAAVDDSQGFHAERAGTLHLEHKMARLPILQGGTVKQSRGKPSETRAEGCVACRPAAVKVITVGEVEASRLVTKYASCSWI